MALIKCPECGKEISDRANNCPGCGCPIGTISASNKQTSPFVETYKKQSVNIKKLLPVIIGIVLVAVIGIVIYNIKVVQPRKVEAQNKATYEEAVDLLEKGKYEEGSELLQGIAEYKDVNTILEQIKWESYTYECINDLKTQLKNPDSFTLYEVAFFLDDEGHGLYGGFVGGIDFSYPAIVFRSGAQNGFGGNTIGYDLFYYFKDKGYTYVGSCDSLDEDEYYNDEGELKDEENDNSEALLCGEINELMKEAEQVGNVDMNRIKIIIKNDSYSTIKIIE